MGEREEYLLHSTYTNLHQDLFNQLPLLLRIKLWHTGLIADDDDDDDVTTDCSVATCTSTDNVNHSVADSQYASESPTSDADLLVGDVTVDDTDFKGVEQKECDAMDTDKETGSEPIESVQGMLVDVQRCVLKGMMPR